MGGAAGKPTKHIAGAPERHTGLLPAFALWNRSPGGNSGIWDAEGNFANKSLLDAVDKVLLQAEAHPSGRCDLDGTIAVAMSRMMEEFQRVRVWNDSQLPVAIDRLSLVSNNEPLMVFPSAGDRGSTASTGDISSATVSTDGNRSRVSWAESDAVADVRNGEFLDKIDLVCPNGVSVLHEIAERVIRAGRTAEFLQAFSNAPCDVLDSFLYIIRIERSSWTKEIRMKWWSRVIKVFEMVIDAMQKQLYAQNLGAFHSFRDEYFMAIAHSRILDLLALAEESTRTSSHEGMLPDVLGTYESLSYAAPSLLLLFDGGGERKALVSELILDILTKLADVAKTMLSGLIAKIQNDSSHRLPSAAYGVHPLTRYAMTHMEQLAPHRTVLSFILATGDVDVLAGGDERVATFGSFVAELIESLERNLENQEKCPLLSALNRGLPHLFLANNISFVLNRVADADVESVLGDEWVARRRGQLEQLVASYVEVAWGPVVACLDTSGKPASPLSKFSVLFKEVQRSQVCREVPDPALRAALRKAVSGVVVPAYSTFVQKHPKIEKWFNYTVDDMAELLSQLFEGEAAHRRNS